MICLLIYILIAVCVSIYGVIVEYRGRRSIYHHKGLPYKFNFIFGCCWIIILIVGGYSYMCHKIEKE